MRVVVAGAGMAGLRTAEAVRKAGFTGEIIVVGAEPRMPYNRPPLSKDAIGAGFDEGTLPFRVSKAAADVEWRLGTRVIAADLAGRTVTLADGTRLSWDGLAAATGVRSRRLTLPGPEAGRHAIRTLDDLEGLRKDLDRARRIVVVGGGFIGCEVAAAAVRRGLAVTVVDPEPLPMLRPLGAQLAAALLRRHQARGAEFRLGAAPVSFGGESRVESVLLSEGTSVAADVVVESVGSVLNTEWLDGNGLDLRNGVLTDNRLRVLDRDHGGRDGAGRDDVIAVGDVARFPHPLFGGVAQRAEHWTVAGDTGRYAGAVLGRHLSGGDRAAGGPFTAIPTFWSDQYEMRIQSFGVTGLHDARVLEGDLDGDVAVGYHRDGRLVGVVLIGLSGRYQHYRTLIGSTARQELALLGVAGEVKQVQQGVAPPVRWRAGVEPAKALVRGVEYGGEDRVVQGEPLGVNVVPARAVPARTVPAGGPGIGGEELAVPVEDFRGPAGHRQAQCLGHQRPAHAEARPTGEGPAGQAARGAAGKAAGKAACDAAKVLLHAAPLRVAPPSWRLAGTSSRGPARAA